jgi:elongation factor G
MSAVEPGKIRNVAVVGHRGTGKTSLVEALLFQGGAVNRLGTVEQQTTVSDWEEEEHKRQMSLAASLCHLEWQGRKINILDTPGDPGFQADTIAALHVVEGAIVVVSAVAGVEVQTTRSWERCNELGISRLILVNMLDRERADFFGTYEQLRAQLSERCIAIEIPIGQEHELSGVVDLLHMRAYDSPEGEKEGEPKEIPNELAVQAAEYREKLVDAVVETDEKVMERYLEGEEITGDELAGALKNAVARGELFPVACGAATKNLGAAALLDLLVEGVPSPAKKPLEIAQSNGGTSAFVFKTLADPFAGRITLFRVLSGQLKGDSTLLNARTRSKERVGQLLELQGKDHTSTEAFEAGDIGAVAKLKETATGDLLLSEDEPVELPSLDLPQPVMSFAITPKAKGDEEKMGQALRRLAEEDQTLVLRRDEQTGEQLLAGMSQMHVEVAVERMKRRFSVDVELHQPRVPYLETIRKESRAQGRYKKQTGGRGDYSVIFLRYEEVPAHVAERIVEQVRREREEAKSS